MSMLVASQSELSPKSKTHIWRVTFAHSRRLRLSLSRSHRVTAGCLMMRPLTEATTLILIRTPRRATVMTLTSSNQKPLYSPTERDSYVLKAIAAFGGLTALQVSTLFFPPAQVRGEC